MNLSEMTKKVLYGLASKYKIVGRTKMSREELEKALHIILPLTKSSTHTPTKAEETAKIPSPKKNAPPEYPIPDRYQIDTVVLLPVNPKREYVYWEVSDKTYKSFISRFGIADASFVLKIFSQGEKTEEIASVRVGMYGSWFFQLYEPDKLLWAEIGLMDNKGNYFNIAKSRAVRMPSDKVTEIIDEETWMTVGEKIEEIFRLSGVNDLGSNSIGSMQMLKEKMYSLEKNISSGEVIKREGR